MKHFLALLLLAPVLPLTAQQTGIEQSSELLVVPAGDKFLHWYGHADRSYFLQVSDANNPLAKWFWAPVIEGGNNEEISYEVDGTASKGFFRLLHTTLPQPPGVTLEEWDADDDRLHNWEEITTHGSNPLKSDTDDDGLPDDWEIAHGLNVLDDGTEDPDRGPDAPFGSPSSGSRSVSAFATPQPTVTNSQAFAANVQAVPGAKLTDKDGDLIPDAEDADPLSLAVNWRKSPKPAYIAIPVPGWSSATHSFPVALNNPNDVLTNRAVYKNGQWISLNANFSPTGRGAALSYKFLIAGRLHPCRLGQCVVNSISDQGHIMGSGKIFIDDVTVTDPVTGEITGYAAGYSPEFAMIWRNPQALPEIFGIAPGATLQGAFHAQSGTLHRDGTVIISNKRPEDIFVNNNATLQRWPNSANGGGMQTSPPYSSPTYSYPAPGGSFAFGSSLSNSPISPIMSWIWPASSGPQSLYSVTRSAPGAPALNFQSLPTTIGSAPGGEACVNLSGQVLVGHSGRYHQVPALQGATKISPHGAALLPGTFGNPAIWYGGSTYSLSSCVANPQALGTTLTVRDLNENGSMLAIVNVGLGSQRLVMLHPIEVNWKAIDGFDNVDDHIDPWNKPIYGKRIYPDFKNPDDTEIRHKLEVIVKTSPALVGKVVFVKAFDVDDSTSEDFDKNPITGDPVIDADKAGHDNLLDYLNTPKTGQFWTGSAWGSNSAEGVVDVSGQTKFIFRVGMQPGSNYRVVASVIDESMYAGVQVLNTAAAKYLGPELQQNGDAPASPLLTVWRRLWVENDSMEQIPVSNGNKLNDLQNGNNLLLEVYPSSTQTFIGFDPVYDTSSFSKLEKGRIVIQGNSYGVVGTGPSPPPNLNLTNAVAIMGNHPALTVGSVFRLYDDDDRGLSEEPLPRQNLVGDQMKSYFKSAFVEVTDSGSYNSPDHIIFRANEYIANSSTVVINKRDLVDTNELWVCGVTAAYQGPYAEDNDPVTDDSIGESLLFGETASYGPNDAFDHSTVFVEACREAYFGSFESADPTALALAESRLRRWMVAVTAHEMGHQPGEQSSDEDHQELKLMSASMVDVSSFNPENAEFSPLTILRFRKASRWSK